MLGGRQAAQEASLEANPGATQTPALSTRSFQFLAAYLLFKSIHPRCPLSSSHPQPCLPLEARQYSHNKFKRPREADSTLPAQQAHILSRSDPIVAAQWVPGVPLNGALCAGLDVQLLPTLGPHWQPQPAADCAKPTPSSLWRKNKKLLCLHACYWDTDAREDSSSSKR